MLIELILSERYSGRKNILKETSFRIDCVDVSILIAGFPKREREREVTCKSRFLKINEGNRKIVEDRLF